ncbi:unnamed protein product [Lupinus luteus]|uniref:F-box protein n=1 Tax=Lupinus luteus TaxID=3873 RepID=A0AAV1YHC3_LUPLU
MTNLKDSNDIVSSLSFTEFPEDVQLTILSFLTPSEITNFACTSKRFVSLCQNDTKLWFTMCHRRWGPKTHINKWVKGKVTFKLLYRTLHDWDNLIGFWRRSGNQGTTTTAATPSLVFFEWGPSFISGSRVSPSKTRTYDVIKSPFLWMGLSSEGQVVNYLDPSGRVELNSDLFEFGFGFGFSENELIPVNRRNGFRRSSSGVNFGGDDDFGVGENMSGVGLSRSLPDKGICHDLSLAFYLVAYDDIGGIACRLVGDYPDYFSSYAPVCWTSKAKFLESPFSLEEESLYDSRIHLRPLQADKEVHEQFPFSDAEVVNQIQQFHLSDNEVVHRILHVSSHYDLVIPDLGGTINPRNTEGRIWQYQSGTFRFGFIHDNFVIDMKHIIQDGCILDAVNPSAN